VQLDEYIVHAVTGGMNALGEVTVRVRTTDAAPRIFSGHGTDTDILVASAKAYLAALNKVAMTAGYQPAQREPDGNADSGEGLEENGG